MCILFYVGVAVGLALGVLIGLGVSQQLRQHWVAAIDNVVGKVVTKSAIQKGDRVLCVFMDDAMTTVHSTQAVLRHAVRDTHFKHHGRQTPDVYIKDHQRDDNAWVYRLET